MVLSPPILKFVNIITTFPAPFQNMRVSYPTENVHDQILAGKI